MRQQQGLYSLPVSSRARACSPYSSPMGPTITSCTSPAGRSETRAGSLRPLPDVVGQPPKPAKLASSRL